MRFPIWRIHALVMVALLFIAGSAAAQGVTREQLIGTWWNSQRHELLDLLGVSAPGGGIVWRFRDDGSMTYSIMAIMAGSYQFQILYARWELEDDRLTLIPLSSLFGPGPSFTVMIAFEDEALIIPDPYSGERITFQPGGIPPEAIPEGNALSGTVTYSDGSYDWIAVLPYKFENWHEVWGDDGDDLLSYFPSPPYGGAFMYVEGEWQIFGLEDGVWFVTFIVVDEDAGGGDHIVAIGTIVSEAGDFIVASEEDSETVSPADFDGISLEGGQQVVTGLDIVLRASGTTVEAAAWGEVKALFR